MAGSPDFGEFRSRLGAVLGDRRLLRHRAGDDRVGDVLDDLAALPAARAEMRPLAAARSAVISGPSLKKFFNSSVAMPVPAWQRPWRERHRLRAGSRSVADNFRSFSSTANKRRRRV